MNILLDLTVLELLVAAVCLLAAATGIGTRHDREAFAFAIVGVAALILVVVTK